MNREIGVLLRLEGLVVLTIGLVVYRQLEAGWLLFALLFFVPDVSMVGYLIGRKTGATVYNAAHTYLGPAVLGAGAYFMDAVLAAQIAVIWACHIGFDRLFGFGLKYPSGFGDTHLQIRKAGPR